VLDIATGSGNVAVAAAEAGVEVVGVDITDAWFPEARRRAKAAGVHLDRLLGDAEELPVGDASLPRRCGSAGRAVRSDSPRGPRADPTMRRSPP